MIEQAREPLLVTDADLVALEESSVQLILRLQDPSGAYPASPTFSAYKGYSWFRDGAFIADAMSAAGEIDSAGRFFDWCADILVARRAVIANIVARSDAGEHVEDSELLPARFAFDGTDGDDDWWDFQLDGYGTWLWAVSEHARRHGLSLERWLPGIILTADYLTRFWDRPCFDWWEEQPDKLHVSTLGCVSAGLRSVADALDEPRRSLAVSTVDRIGDLVSTDGLTDGHLAKWLGSTDVDASLAAIVYPLNVFPASGDIGRRTVLAVDDQLSEVGGVHRYLADTFYGGGQWPLLSCLLGLAWNAAGNPERARELLRSAAATATETGDLPEQVGIHLLAPSVEQEWIDRWGTVATPLLWSHAMFIRLAIELRLEPEVPE